MIGFEAATRVNAASSEAENLNPPFSDPRKSGGGIDDGIGR